MVDLSLVSTQAMIAAARGDGPAADAHAVALVDWARQIGDPQIVHPALAIAARLALEAGDRERATDLLGESVRGLAAAPGNIAPETIEAAIVAEALDLGTQLLGEVAAMRSQTPWAEASAAILERRFDDASDLLEAHEDHTHAALVRLVGAERGGHRTPGLEKAIAFYEGVSATAYLARAAAVGAS